MMVLARRKRWPGLIVAVFSRACQRRLRSFLLAFVPVPLLAFPSWEWEHPAGSVVPARRRNTKPRRVGLARSGCQAGWGTLGPGS